MQLSATAVPVQEILPWRERYRQEMNCQVVHDSLHGREGWTQSYLLKAGPTAVGYCALAVAGPWKGTKTAFELYVAPEQRSRAFELFEALVATAGVTAFEVQTNEVLLTEILHRWCPNPKTEKIVFRDERSTTLTCPAGAGFRRTAPADAARMFPHHAEPVGSWLVEVGGVIAATGGILFHYNKPYGDLYMEVSAASRRRGLGSYLVQELKRVCREGGSVPCARCSPGNLASQKTLQKAGLVPCAKILAGPLVVRGEKSPPQ